MIHIDDTVEWNGVSKRISGKVVEDYGYGNWLVNTTGEKFVIVNENSIK